MRVRPSWSARALVGTAAALVVGAGVPAAVAVASTPDRPTAATLVAVVPPTAGTPPVVVVHPARPEGSQPGTPTAPRPATTRPAPVRPALPIGTVPLSPGIPHPLPAGAVALTFDDGPDPTWTPRVLAVLAQYHAKATFFDIGQQAAAYPALVKAEYAQGHGVGNHTWSHPDLTKLTPPQVADQVARTAAVITAATGHLTQCLRPPYDAFDPTVETVVGQQREALLTYDVDPRDWARPGAQAIANRVLASIHPGAVVDLHDAGGDRSETLAALPLIMQGLAARHLVTVPICR